MMQINPTDYELALAEKTAQLSALIAPFAPQVVPAVFASTPTGFRMRAEFRLWHDADGLHYAMSPKGEKINAQNVIFIEDFPIACEKIRTLMPQLKAALNAQPHLREKLFQVEFLTSTQQDAVISLIYHKPLDNTWQTAAVALAKSLGVSLIGRARGQKIVVGQSYVDEQLKALGKTFYTRQYEQAFAQPNALVCEKMLAWAMTQADHIHQAQPQSNHDLLELYCGNGNFTFALAPYFRRVLATEISKVSVAAFSAMQAKNQAENIEVARLSAEEFCAAFDKQRTFKRLQQQGICLDDYQFSTIFVDPPRAGTDPDTTALMQRFGHILYISCNPLSVDFKTLCQTHTLESAALFDQFPWTKHIEAGFYFRKK